MNRTSLCNSALLHPHSLSCFQSSCSFASSYSSSVYLISTRSTYISISHRIRQSFRAVVDKRNNRFRSFAVNKRRNGYPELIELESTLKDDDDDEEEEEEEDWGEFDLEAEGDDEEGEFLPMDKMKRWLEKKPRGFGVGKKYETSIEDKLLDEIEQSWKAQAANLNKLKTNPLKPQLNRNDSLNKGTGETQNGFRVRVTNLPKKKNVHRDLKVAFKEVSGILNIAPAVIGNKKTKDPICKGFALVDFKTEIDAKRFVEQFSGERLSFGKVIKQIKCQVVEFSSSNESVSEGEYSDKGFKEQDLPFSYSEAVSNAVEEDDFLDSQEVSDDSDEEVDETEMEEEEEDEQNPISSSTETPIELRLDSKTNLRSQKQVVKQEIREHEVVETPLVSFQANRPEEAVAGTQVDDVEVAEENPEPLNSSIQSSQEKQLDRIRKLELKLLGKEKLLGGGGDSDQAKPKSGSVEGKKKEKKKKKKILVKGQAKKAAKIEIPGSSKRLKVKEKALLTGVLTKYAAIAASNLK